MSRMTSSWMGLAAVLVTLGGCGTSSRVAEPGPAPALPANADEQPDEAPDGGASIDASVSRGDAGMPTAPTVEAGIPKPVAPRRGAASLDRFYDRVARDLAAGAPLVTTVYVALCDNDSQGIVPVRNRKICDGDDPARNMYWVSSGGLAGWARKQRWKSVHRSASPDGTVMVEQVWRKSLRPGKELRARGVRERFDAYVIGLAYRGREIHRAMADYLRAVHHDDPLPVSIEGLTISGGGAGHLVGYQGHDYIMDVLPDSPELADLRAQMGGQSTLPKGAFALACAGDSYIRSGITRPNVYVMLLNVYLAFPNAWAIGGLLDGVAAGADGRGVYRSAARAFAKGQEVDLGWAFKSFAHGPKRKQTE